MQKSTRPTRPRPTKYEALFRAGFLQVCQQQEGWSYTEPTFLRNSTTGILVLLGPPVPPTTNGKGKGS